MKYVYEMSLWCYLFHRKYHIEHSWGAWYSCDKCDRVVSSNPLTQFVEDEMKNAKKETDSN